MKTKTNQKKKPSIKPEPDVNGLYLWKAESNRAPGHGLWITTRLCNPVDAIRKATKFANDGWNGWSDNVIVKLEQHGTLDA